MSSALTEHVPIYLDDHGILRVEGSRLGLDVLISDYNNGASPEEIAYRYDGSLELADVYAIITYYLRHKSELDAHIAEQDRLANENLERLGVVEGSRKFRAVLEERRKSKL